MNFSFLYVILVISHVTIATNGLHMACGGFQSTFLFTVNKPCYKAKTLLAAVHPP